MVVAGHRSPIQHGGFEPRRWGEDRGPWRGGGGTLDVGLPGPSGLRIEAPQPGRRLSGDLPAPARSRGRFLAVFRARRLPSREEVESIEIGARARGGRTAGCQNDSEHVNSPVARVDVVCSWRATSVGRDAGQPRPGPGHDGATGPQPPTGLGLVYPSLMIFDQLLRQRRGVAPRAGEPSKSSPQVAQARPPRYVTVPLLLKGRFSIRVREGRGIARPSGSSDTGRNRLEPCPEMVFRERPLSTRLG